MPLGMLQLREIVDAIRAIGFANTISVVLLLAAGWAIKWLFNKHDEKDKLLLQLLDKRHEDVVLVEKSMQASVHSQEHMADALETLADELRRRN